MNSRRLTKLLFLIPLLAAGAATAYLLGSYNSLPVNPDAGYYLSVAREVAAGAVPVADVSTAYTPGFYYIMAFWIKLADPGFDRAVLLIFMIHLLNGLLLYNISGFFLHNMYLRAVLALSYILSVYFLEGYVIALEPFQVLFGLAAYLAYLRLRSSYTGYALAGFLLGCSIMCKQYAIFLLAGFLVAVWLDSGHRSPRSRVVKRLSVAMIAAIFPFLLFIAFSGAGIKESVYSFFLFRGNPLYYLSQGKLDVYAKITDMLLRMLEVHWLFIPVFIYSLLRFRQKDFVRPNASVMPLFLASLLPLVVRQFSHYFQFVAPWSFILLAIILEDARSGLKEGMDNRFILAALLLCTLIVLPVALWYAPFFTRDFYLNHKAELLLVMGLYTGAVTTVTAAGIYRAGYPSGMRFLAFLVAAFIFFEVLFVCLRLPVHEWKAARNYQEAEAAILQEIFPERSPVLVLGCPQLYITCNYSNPLHDYDLAFPDQSNTDRVMTAREWDRVDKVIVRSAGLESLRTDISGRGFREVNAPQLGYLMLFSRK